MQENKYKKWVAVFSGAGIFMMLLVICVNYVVDPFSITGQNLLNIKLKMVSDDRTEKVEVLRNRPRYNNVMLGSSRVYLMNPLMVSRYIGGTTYNLGVGTAQPEDHLGFLLLLEKMDKFPSSVILGLDFYSFNKNLETNKYFIRNEDINFLHISSANTSELVGLLSLKMLKASVQTLKVHFGLKHAERHFDENGASSEGSTVFDYYPIKNKEEDIYAMAKRNRSSDFIYNPKYIDVSEDRVSYLKRVVALCKKHNARLVVFITPLYGKLLRDIYKDENLNRQLKKFKGHLAEITTYYDFLTLNEISRDARYFGDPSHVRATTGNMILAKLFADESVELPDDFGVLVDKLEVDQ
jgi:hypothetical protein